MSQTTAVEMDTASSVPGSAAVESSCKCNGVCSRKDGAKAKGCPCKTRGDFCIASCKCLATSKKCQNQPDFVRPTRTRANTGQSQRNQQTANCGTTSSSATSTNNNARLSEMAECARENTAVENLISNLEEDNVHQLAIRVLSRGIGSLEFIQSQLIPEGDDDSGPMINRHGSPLRPLTVRCPGNSSVTPEVDPSSPSDPPTVTPEVEPNPLTDPPPSPDRPRQQTTPVPEWCRCGHCRQMPKDVENVCCKKKECVTSTQRFYKLCLDPDILQLCVLNRADIRNDPIDNSTRQFRKAAYRQYILDKYGYLGRGNRKVVPSCTVWKVRGKYPSPTGVYMGFRNF